MAINADDINVGAAKIVRNVKNIKGLAKLASRKSIMTMAQPGMYQYPIVASNSIDTDVLMAISKAYQLTYAANVATAYSLNPIMYTKDTPELSDFVQKFHTNSNMPTNVVGAANNIGIESFIEDGIAVESATVDKTFTSDEYAIMNSRVWSDLKDSIVTESLNDMYRPYDRTYHILKDKVNTMKKATEGKFTDSLNSLSNTADQINQTVNSTGNGPGRGNYSTNIGLNKERVMVSNFKNEVVRNDKLEALEPTMVNVQIISHGPKLGQATHNLTIGVKAVPHILSTDLMIASMTEVCKESNKIFKFLKWTKGEIKTLDFVLGFSAAKKKAIEKNAKQEVRWLKQSAARKKINGIGQFLNNEKLPTVSVVLTSYEVAKIKELCNVDLNDARQAFKIMNKYYLLSIAIYDTEKELIKFLFDCEDNWSYTSVSSMRLLSDKLTDLLNQQKVSQITGRR